MFDYLQAYFNNKPFFFLLLRMVIAALSCLWCIYFSIVSYPDIGQWMFIAIALCAILAVQNICFAVLLCLKRAIPLTEGAWMANKVIDQCPYIMAVAFGGIVFTLCILSSISAFVDVGINNQEINVLYELLFKYSLILLVYGWCRLDVDTDRLRVYLTSNA